GATRAGRRRRRARRGPRRHPHGAAHPAARATRGHRARILCGADADRDRRPAPAAARHGQNADPARSRAAPRGGEARDMNDHETYESLAAVYAVGALDGDDLARFEAHLAEGCERCEAIVRESREALTRTVLAASRAVPPPEAKAALQARIAAIPPSARALRRGWLTWVAATAAVVALAVMLASGVVA